MLAWAAAVASFHAIRIPSSSWQRAAVPRCCTGAGEDDTEVLPQAYFKDMDYTAAGVPWDLYGRPQPPVRAAALEGKFGVAGTTILDCGAGAGDNANWLAARGYNVLGFDLSPSAVATARERAAEEATRDAITAAAGSVDFIEASATDLASSSDVQSRAKEVGGFEVVLDSAMLHCLDDDAQRAYIEGLRDVTRVGGRLYLGCFSDANPDPWSNPRRLSEAHLRAMLSEAAGWRVVTLTEAWYERPRARSASSGGAWTMAWWCVAERCDPPAVAATASRSGTATMRAKGAYFPTPETTPAEVISAQLDALRTGDLGSVYNLLSRARRFSIQETIRRDLRERHPPPERVYDSLKTTLSLDVPGLIGHQTAEIVASLSDPAPPRGRLKKWTFRVRVDEARHYIFVLTQQSAYDGGDPRDYDGFEQCWFVWNIVSDDGGGSPDSESAPAHWI